MSFAICELYINKAVIMNLPQLEVQEDCFRDEKNILYSQ